MSVSTLKPSGGLNDFNLSLTGATTSVTLDREYASGAYSITSSSNDITLDVYAYNADGSLAGYTNTKSLTATKGFGKFTIIGGTNGDVLSFTYKKTYVTANETDQVTAGPYIISSSPSSLPEVDDVVTILGGNFAIDVEVHFIGQNNVVYDAKSITRVSATEIQVTRPDSFLVAQSPYSIRVMNPGIPNPSGSALNIASNAVSAGSTTSWVTNSPLPAFSVNFPYSTTVLATDPDGSTITYSLVSGALPTGITFSNGTISGTNTDVTTEGQTFTVVIRATDEGSNYTDRSFTLSANLRPDWVTNVGDIDAANYNQSYSYQLQATSGSLGGSITYALQSGTLPTGLSLSSTGLITGTSTAAINSISTFTVRATDSLGASTDRQFNILTDVASQQLFTSSTTWTVPANVNSISVVAVGGGGGGSTSTTSTGGFSGGGGAGGALHWRNAIAVTPGESLSIGVGAAGSGGTAAGSDNATAGGESFVKRSTTYLVQAPGGEAGKYNLNNTSLGGVPNTALGGGGGTGGRGGAGVNGQGVGQPWVWNGTTATATLAYTGAVQALTFPTNAVVTFDAVGGAGAGSNGGAARVQGQFTATAGTYNFRVGGAGGQNGYTSAGYNGGGSGAGSTGREGGGGGGATDIRPASDDTLAGRIVVAAGSGGGQWGQGGAGGYPDGSAGINGQGAGGGGGTQTNGGSGGGANGGSSGSAGGFGVGGAGGNSYLYGGGGGGGGYYGGGGAGADVDPCCSNSGGGGGGSSYTSAAVTNVTHTGGYRNTGNGSITVTFATATNPNTPDAYPSGGGGGAAGYSGDGGDGATNATFVATAGAGGAGSGSTGHNAGGETTIVGGGGVGLLGEGASGAAPAASAGQAGNPGSGGTGRTYGAGGAGADDDSAANAGNGGAGAVRIIWGSGRQFPATQTGDK